MSFNRNKARDRRMTEEMLRNPSKAVGDKNWLDHTKACAKIDKMLLKSANLDQLLMSGRKLNAVRAHLNHLRVEHGLTIDSAGGTYRFSSTVGSEGTTERIRESKMQSVANKARKNASETTAQMAPSKGADRAGMQHSSGRKATDAVMVIKQLFADAQRLIEKEAQRNSEPDLHRQLAIISSRRCDRITSEAGILNTLIIQASSYSVIRKYFNVLYPEEIYRFDDHYDTRFFPQRKVPEHDYAAWDRIVLAWGNGLLRKEGAMKASSLDTLVSLMQHVHHPDWKSYIAQPRSRLVLSMATALPKVKRELLTNPKKFLDNHHHISKEHPGRAYDLATSFSKGIIQMGNPLVCNFFKDLGLTYYVKVDVHVSDFLEDISFGHNLGPKEQFILGWLLSREANMEPFFLDKILYLGGKYCKPGLKALFHSYRAKYMDAVNRLIDEIPLYA